MKDLTDEELIQKIENIQAQEPSAGEYLLMTTKEERRRYSEICHKRFIQNLKDQNQELGELWERLEETEQGKIRMAIREKWGNTMDPFIESGPFQNNIDKGLSVEYDELVQEIKDKFGIDWEAMRQI